MQERQSYKKKGKIEKQIREKKKRGSVLSQRQMVHNNMSEENAPYNEATNDKNRIVGGKGTSNSTS